MKILQILRSKPDEKLEKIIKIISDNNEGTAKKLYEDDIDWPGLIDDIFLHEKVISWM